MSKRSVVHVEIPAANRDAAAKFYEAMFGWTFRHEDANRYTVFETGNIGGGFADVGGSYQPGAVLIYIASDDIEADLAKAQSLGATVVQDKMEIPGMGWMAWFNDPTGNRIALWTAANPPQ